MEVDRQLGRPSRPARAPADVARIILMGRQEAVTVSRQEIEGLAAAWRSQQAEITAQREQLAEPTKAAGPWKAPQPLTAREQSRLEAAERVAIRHRRLIVAAETSAERGARHEREAALDALTALYPEQIKAKETA